MRLSILALVAALVSWPAAGPAHALEYPVTPLEPASAQAFGAMRPDPPPRKLIRNTHYWTSNEWRHDLFLPQVAGLGGVHVGVGTDQNYLLAGWSRPQVLVLLDFDQAIVDLHRVYGVLFLRRSSPAGFIAAWHKDAADHVEALVRTELASRPDLERVVAVFRRARPIVRGRLVSARASYRTRGVATFLDSQEQYDWLRALWFSGRVFPLRGNLTGSEAVGDVGAAIRAAGLSLGTLYLSNAEQYFDYRDAFRKNIASLPSTRGSVVLHTLGWRSLGFADGDYHYLWQSLDSFQRWLATTRVKSLGRMARWRERTDTRGLSRLPDAPPKRLVIRTAAAP